ncbi:MAG: hypothetical protein ACJA2S_003721 [Cyclobacteriaceae bacterium]|jgi:hypothetical protein
MKKLILFLLFNVILNSLAQAQFSVVTLNNLSRELNSGIAAGESNPDIKGSPYLAEEFEKGEVYYGGKFLVKDVSLRYNMFNDVMEFKNGKTIMNLDGSMNINKVIIGDDVFISIKKSTDKSGPKGFVKLWNDQYPSIATKMKAEFFEKEADQAFSEPRPARFERKIDENFLMKKEGEFERVKSVKKLVQALGDYQGELSTYVKKEKISSNDPAELGKLLSYYHGLKAN